MKCFCIMIDDCYLTNFNNVGFYWSPNPSEALIFNDYRAAETIKSILVPQYFDEHVAVINA